MPISSRDSVTQKPIISLSPNLTTTLNMNTTQYIITNHNNNSTQQQIQNILTNNGNSKILKSQSQFHPSLINTQINLNNSISILSSNSQQKQQKQITSLNVKN